MLQRRFSRRTLARPRKPTKKSILQNSSTNKIICLFGFKPMVTVEVSATQHAAPTAATGDGTRMLKIGLPIGFRFCMADEELLLHYLHREDLSSPFPVDIALMPTSSIHFNPPIQQ
ncbi:hypothetical protein GUJ93_ZPchr0003g16861 [Zizania palustris]|uniref:NAC domain-containing protein n=1 Tax=Zizania palustris TaxID=103762 RepID=A0A8J5SB97_ZIZPA|nr:hypothetical protein GUJ93_ZPchr0003g16861 [Zizania palustris]